MANKRLKVWWNAKASPGALRRRYYAWKYNRKIEALGDPWEQGRRHGYRTAIGMADELTQVAIERAKRHQKQLEEVRKQSLYDGWEEAIKASRYSSDNPQWFVNPYTPKD